MDKTRPIIIIKKKGGHGGHHGGAWKVAYADFVTAMMALFIVLWLLNTSKQIQEAVGGYFKDPTGTSKKVGSNMVGRGRKLRPHPRQHAEAERAAAEGHEADDGLREAEEPHRDDRHRRRSCASNCSESATGTFFDSGSAKLNDDGRELLITLAQELGKLPNKLSIEGHTDSTALRCHRRLTATGNSPPIAPTRRGASCRQTASGPTRSRKFADSPTSACASPMPHSTPPTAASR